MRNFSDSKLLALCVVFLSTDHYYVYCDVFTAKKPKPRSLACLLQAGGPGD